MTNNEQDNFPKSPDLEQDTSTLFDLWNEYDKEVKE